jgi:hypothetical protein
MSESTEPTESAAPQEPAGKPFRVEVAVQAPMEEVWRALTEPDRLRQWFGWDYEGLDAEIEFIVEKCQLEPPDRIAMGELGGAIELTADGGRTIVRAIRPGPLDDARWEDIYDGIEEGWRAFFEQLRFWLERHPRAGRRRTIYLSGVAASADVLPTVTGEPWHESRLQRMCVAADGHLVGAAAQQPLTAAEPGPISVTVTTYGLDDDAFEAVRAEWARRWQSIAKDAEVTT